ncbi:hypothetical protein [Chromobacterium sp.]|uniref:hypothetical protein n=1 Tax=Chromobacterium sp. TaxID=306190 RepID=UPI0035AE37B9
MSTKSQFNSEAALYQPIQEKWTGYGSTELRKLWRRQVWIKSNIKIAAGMERFFFGCSFCLLCWQFWLYGSAKLESGEA